MSRFEDERGTIEDILGPVDSVTRILTKKGAVRGNHVHLATIQWTLVLTGELWYHDRFGGFSLKPGNLQVTKPGNPHAWRAEEDTLCLVFTKGPRGEDYESDTIRLDDPLL